MEGERKLLKLLDLLTEMRLGGLEAETETGEEVVEAVEVTGFRYAGELSSGLSLSWAWGLYSTIRNGREEGGRNHNNKGARSTNLVLMWRMVEAHRLGSYNLHQQ